MIVVVLQVWAACLAAAVVAGGVVVALEARRRRRAWRALALPALRSGRRGGKTASAAEAVRRT